MTVRRHLALFVTAAVLAAVPFTATAHRQWIVPSATVLSGDDPWVSFDAAVSNELFYADHNPLKLDNLSVELPDGTYAAPENIATGKYRSVFDLHLTQPGTYKVFTAGDNAMASYELNGEKKRWRGKKDEIGTAIPEGATNVELSEGQNRLEVFVTRGAPTDTVFKPIGLGLELVPVTHPNDLFVGEAASFKLLLDGQPAKGVEVTYIPGNARYRNGTGEAKVTTGDDGSFQITFPEAGMFWVNATQQDLPSQIEGAKRRVGYTTVLEVLNP
ncbi:hypothetical protein sos41_04190 [Alphaproteobacteria bacterium SO-S41]|nr:hypothetical protein sos41_04190 [Alphaproteobacteria bacterium SO-S41]